MPDGARRTPISSPLIERDATRLFSRARPTPERADSFVVYLLNRVGEAEGETLVIPLRRGR